MGVAGTLHHSMLGTVLLLCLETLLSCLCETMAQLQKSLLDPAAGDEPSSSGGRGLSNSILPLEPGRPKVWWTGMFTHCHRVCRAAWGVAAGARAVLDPWPGLGEVLLLGPLVSRLVSRSLRCPCSCQSQVPPCHAWRLAPGGVAVQTSVVNC